MTAIEKGDVDRFARAILRRFGLRFEETRRDQFTDVLRLRVEARGAPVATYLARLEAGHAEEEEVLAERLTIGETYFFRYKDHFRAFSTVVLPEVLARGAARISVLSAGCSSGEEPYSIAMAIRDAVPDLSRVEVAIRGVDLNPAALAKARRGRYAEWSLRETPDPIRARYFKTEGKDVTLDPAVRRMVEFERANLSTADAELLRPGGYDVIFCRNVTIYFSPDVTAALMTRFARALAPSGFLFLGHAETLRGVSKDFVLCRAHDAFFYRVKGSEAIDRRDVAEQAPPRPSSAASWFETVSSASGRIAALDGAPAAARAVAAVPAPVPALASAVEPPWPGRAAAALALFQRERFAEAMATLGGPAADSADSASRLLVAVLLVNEGNVDDAERACRRLLADDDLNAGAHYVMALCREHAGDAAGALEEDRIAAYLDPTFAMPHLHRGLLSRRARRLGEARAALERAAALLVSESDARILLFGGGFGRDALVALCRAELRASEGPP